MTFKEYYKSLRRLERPMHPARAFVLNVAALTGRSPKTVNQWLSGVQQPTAEDCNKISRELGIDVGELFP